jgi:hypothetical protein
MNAAAINYDLTGRTRTVLISGIVLGLICLVLTWLGDDGHHTRFWSNFLHNSVFFTGIALMAGFFMSASITAWAGWYVAFKRVWESMSLFLLVGIVLMGIMGIATFLRMHDLYHWNWEGVTEVGHENYDELIAGKSGFLNRTWYLVGTFFFLGLTAFIVSRIRSLSLAEEANGDSEEFKYHYGIRKYAAFFLPVAGFGSAAMIWQWIMSVDAHWYSTMFAWYTGASWFVSMVALTILIIIFLKSRGLFQTVSTEHLHDLGKFLFAFSIFWTYVWFSQYMLIWYANVGEETIYFRERVDNYPVLFYINILINFIAPFFILMRNDTKRKIGTLTFTAGLVLFGHWLDFFLMLKPGITHSAHLLGGHGHGHDDHGGHDHGATDHGHEAGHDAAHSAGHGAEDVLHGSAESAFELGTNFPGFLELGTFIGFLSLFFLFVLGSISRANLQSSADPYMEESLHHHT